MPVIKWLLVALSLNIFCVSIAVATSETREREKKRHSLADSTLYTSSEVEDERRLRTPTPTNLNSSRSTLSLSDSSWNGEFYAEHRTLQALWAMDALMLWNNISSSPIFALDVGCGDGSVTKEIIHGEWRAERGLKEGNKKKKFDFVAGIDPSIEMLQKAAHYNITGILDFNVGGAQEIPYEDEIFNVVTMFSAYHWVPLDQKEIAIQEISRVLKPEGIFYCYTWVDHPDDKIRKAFQMTARSELWKPKLEHFFDTDTFKEPVPLIAAECIKEYLSGAKFELLEWQPHESDEIFDSKEEFSNWLLGWSQFGCLGEEHPNFIAGVVFNYLIITDQQDRFDIHYHDQKLRFVARK